MVKDSKKYAATGVSSARLYWENKFAFFAPKGVTIPVAVSVFREEIYAAPQNWVEKRFRISFTSTSMTMAGTLQRGNNRQL